MRAAEPLDETDTPSAIVLFAKTRATVIPRDSDEWQTFPDFWQGLFKKAP